MDTSRANPGRAKDSSKRPAGAQQRSPQRSGSRSAAPPTVDPAWLAKAFAIAIGAALLLGYISYCVLFLQGQWQLVLHPTRGSVAPVWANAADRGSLRRIRFGPDASGTPQLTGWWLPGAEGGRYRHLTVLYLASGDGQAATAPSLLPELHRLGLNIFAFDYRGYGESAAGKPSQVRMTEDAETAMHYLGSTLGVAPGRTILYGAGVGGSLAVSLAVGNPAVPAIVLDQPEPDLLARVLRDPRARLVPVRLLFRERFRLFPALAGLKTPKLIVSPSGTEDPRVSGDQSSAAADPKITVALPDATPPLLTPVLSRFFDQYAPPTPAPQIVPNGAASPTGTR